MTSQPAAWLKPPQSIRGLDHLGIRAPCETIYTYLVPGITNVTDRARYYSFYPWLVWATEQHKGALKDKPFYVTLRSAECLLTLIAARHEAKHQFLGQHGGMIGALTLFPALSQTGEDEYIRLSKYADTDGAENRYFKNTLGGLGQYYLGTLREADIVVGDLRSGIRYRDERGLALAKAFDAGVNRKKFFSVLEADRVTPKMLDELEEFCSCQIVSNEIERAVLTDLFFNRQGAFFDENAISRRRSLTLLLDLANQLQIDGDGLPMGGAGADRFRACAYSGALSSGKRWEIRSPDLVEHLNGWGLYHRYELFSIAVQALFWVGLAELQEQGVILTNSEDYRYWFLDTFGKEFKNAGRYSFQKAVEQTASELRPLELGNDPEHEVQLGWDVYNLARAGNDSKVRREVIGKAVKILLLLMARGSDSGSNGFTAGLTPHYLAQYPVNLHHFEQRAENDWKNLSLSEVLGWLAVHWGIDAHIRVALRKMSYDSRDTFKIKPTDQGLRVADEVPTPTFTNPRLSQSIQILFDLGALGLEPDSSALVPTPYGRQLLRECANG